MTKTQRAKIDALKEQLTDLQNKCNRAQSALIKAEEEGKGSGVDSQIKEAQLELE